MKEVHVLRKKLKQQNSQSFTISRSIYTVGSSYFSKQNCLKALCMKRFSEYLFLNIKILLIPLLGSSHIFEIMHAGRTSMQPYTHDINVDLTDAFLSPGVRAELVPLPRAYGRNGAGPVAWLGKYRMVLDAI
jgi:hypothetical protein